MNTATRSPQRSTLERLYATPLRLLTRFGGAELTDRFGLRKPTARVLHDVAKLAAQAMSAVAKPKAGAPARVKSAHDPAVFDLRPTDEQEMLRASARRFADDVLRPAAHDADAALHRHEGPPAEVLARASELGLSALALPEELGGIAETRSIVTSTMVIEELACGDMGLAVAVLAPLGVVHALVEWGTREQQAKWLPRLAGETYVPATLAVLEPRPLFDPLRPRTGAIRASGGFTLHGEKALVPVGALAEVFLVAAEIRGVGPRLFLVERGQPGVHVEPEPAMGLRAAGLSRVRFDGVFVPREAVLGGEGEGFGELDYAAVVDRARIAWGALAVGGARAVLGHVIPYCNERKAFGEPITNRQSVAFMIADLAIELEGMRLLVQRAASLADRGESVTKNAALVRVQCAAKGMKAGTDGVQLLGGHGFVKDHPVERWYRDLRAVGVMEGALLA